MRTSSASMPAAPTAGRTRRGGANLKSCITAVVAVALCGGLLAGCAANNENRPGDGIEIRDTPPPAFDPERGSSSSGQADVDGFDSRVIAENVAKFAAVVDYAVEAALQIAQRRGHTNIEPEDIESAITSTELVEDASIWEVVQGAYGLGLAAPVYGLGVCGVTIDPNWKTRPGAATIIANMECTGTTFEK